MERLKNANSLDKWITMLITVLIFIVPLHSSKLPMGNFIGQCTSIAMVGFSGLYVLWHIFSKETNSKKVRCILLAYLGLMLFLIINGMITGGMEGIRVAISIGGITCTGLACALIDWNQLGKGILIVDFGIILWIYQLYKGLIRWEVKKVYEWSTFSYIYENPNFLGIVILVLILILMLAYSQKRAERYLLYGILLVPILLETGSRTSFIALIVAIGIYMIGYISLRYKMMHWVLWLGVIGGLAGITLIYPFLGQVEGIEEIGHFIKAISQKGLFSGREKLWAEAITFIGEKPLLGYGLQITLQELNHQELNTHNQYLQILLQGGWIGLTFVVGILSAVWYSLRQIRYDRIGRIGGGILIAFLVVACFENTLLGESVTLGILQWSILGVAMSPVILNERVGKVQIKGETNDEKYNV